MFLTVRKRLVSGSSPDHQTEQNCLRGHKRGRGHTLQTHQSRTREVLDGELAVLGEGDVSAESSCTRLLVWRPLAVDLGSGKTSCARGSEREGIPLIVNYCAFSGNLIFRKYA